MKYNTVEIKPIRGKNDFEVLQYSLEGDRHPSESSPNAQGFFHYPATMDKQKAFEMLKATMIESYEEMIRNLTEKVNSLNKLTL